MIVALAGHVDHGKTALVRALTGVETDRLAEERRRGMTIDLGFAYWHPPGKPSIGFVDVPGHERFLPNMLAGVLGIDTVLLVVAADDGPMPQTLEHLTVLGLTGARSVIGVISKADMAGPERVASVAGEVAALLARHGFPAAPVLAVSAVTGAGLDALRALLTDGSRTQRTAPAGGFRMAIDRRFSLRGAGLVVTGTVLAGSVTVGDAVLLTPTRLAARVRSVHVQDRPAERAWAGDRCALAITGARVEAERVARGDWVVAPHLHAPTRMLDMTVRLAPGQALRHGRRAHLHLATAAMGARLRLPDAADLSNGTEGIARLVLDAPLPALAGDRAVLRDEGSGRILGGGRVIDPFPPERRLRPAERAARHAALAEAEPAKALAALLAAEGSVDLRRFALARNAQLEALAAGLTEAGVARVIGGAAPVALSPAAEAAARQGLRGVLAAWHAAHPDHVGPSKGALLARLAREAGPGVAEAMLREMLDAGEVAQTGALYHLPGHAPRLAAADEAAWRRVALLLEEAGLRPPRVRELAELLARPLAETEALLARFARFGRLLRVASNRYFLPETVAALAAIAARLAAEKDGFTAAEFNAASGIGRNLTIEVLEYLDRDGQTQRHGPVRHMRTGSLA